MSKRAFTPFCSLIAGLQLLSAAPDSVDSTFAASAGQFFDAGDFGGISSVLVQPDGKILFGSNEMSALGGTLQVPLVRFNPDGTTDNTFFADNEPNGGGLGLGYYGQGWSEVHALGLQSDGKIIAAGVMQGMNDGTNSFSANSIVRINPNGTVDTTFQTGGTQAWPVGGFNYIEDVTVLPDDKVYCVGGFGGIYGPGFTGPTTRYGIARLNADGSLDTGFHLNPADFGVPAGAANVRGFFTQASPDGSGDIYVVGFFEWGPAFPAAGEVQVFARLNSDGSRDFGFNPSIPANVDRITGVVVEPSGSVTVLGSIGNPATDGYMARFTSTGAVDGSFAYAGGLGVIDARPLQRDPNGRYLVNNGTTLKRVNADGTIDASFDASGAWISNAGRSPYFGTFTTGPDGKIYSGSFFDQVEGVSTVKLVAFEGDTVPAAPGTIQFAAHAFSVNEEDGSVTIPVTRTGGSTGAASASFSMTDINTTAGADYTAVTTTVNFPAGVAGTQYVTIPITITIDGTPESAEVATLNLTGITGAGPGPTTSANLTIIDSDSPPQIVLQPTPIFVPPFDAFQLVVGALSGATPVTYQWKKDGVAIPGATSPLYLVTEANAASHDGSYTVVVTNSNGSVTSTAVDVTVKDPAELSFAAATSEALESDGTATLTVSRGGSSVGAVSVDVTVTGGDATAGTDYTYATQTVSWADGDSTDKTVTITLTDDTDVESPETVVATLANYSPDAVAGATTSTTLTILDDDSPATITTPVADVRAVEGWAATLSVGVESQSPVTYQWFKNGVALPGETAATIHFDPVLGSDFGLYAVEITNSAGTITSGPAELGLRPNPLVQQPVLGFNGSGIIYDPISRAAGGYYIPGSFASWVGAPGGTVNAQRLVRILPDGTPDPSFTPVISSTVTKVHERSDRSIAMIGSFNTVGGLTSKQIAVLNPDGTVDATFAGNVTDNYFNVNFLEVDVNDKVLINHSGGFLRLNADGTPDNAFMTTVESNFDNANVTGAVALPDGGYYLTGSFRLPGEFSNKSLVRVFNDGTLDTGFPPGNVSSTFKLQSDGKIIYGSSSNLQRLNADGTEDPTFTPITGTSLSFTVAPDDSIHLHINNGGTPELRRFDADGNPDPAFNNGSPVVANQSFVPVSLKDGSLYLDGNFTVFNGQSVTQRPVILFGEFSSQEITSQPMLVTVDPADTAVFSVAVSSAQNLTYQWRRNGLNLTDGGDISGATGPTLTIANAEEADEDSYDVVITNSVTGASITSSAADLIVLGAPEIASPPMDATLIVGGTLELSVSTYALAPYTVQWFKTGVGALSGETSETLAINPAAAGDSGRYYAEITNSLGTATTDEAIVQIIADPAGLVAGFIPATAGSNNVQDIAPDDTGGALLTGSYFSLTHPTNNGQAYINRVNATGAPDATFTGSSNQSIGVTTFDGSGGFIVAGFNFFLNGSSGKYLERIDATGQTDATFAANRGFFNFSPTALAVDDAGDIYVGITNAVKRFAADGTPDPTYNPSVSGQVDGLVFNGAGQLHVRTNSSLTVLNPDGTPDTGFTLDPAVSMSGTLGIGVAEDGSIAIGAGNLQSVYVLNPDGSLRSTLPVPGMTYNSFTALDVQANGKILVGYAQGNRLIRLLPDGNEDPMFNVGTGFNGNVSDIDIHSDGTIWVGGSFTSYNGTAAYGYLRLNGDPLDLNINVQPADQVVDIGQTATFTVTATTLGAEPISYQWRKDGTPLANGGDISGADTNTLMIANTDLTDEADYDAVITNLTTGTEKTTLAASLTILESPEILANLEATLDLEVGDSLELAVSARGAGTLGYQWQKDGVDIPGETGSSLTIDLLDVADTGAYRVVVTNTYGSVTSDATTVTVVLSPAAIAAGWSDINFSSSVRAVLPLPDGRTLVGGAFSSLNESGQFVGIDELVLLNTDGTVDRSFDLSPNGAIYSLSMDADGKILVGGQFNFIAGQTRRHVARLNQDLTLDSSFDTSNGPANTVWDVAPAPGGKVYVGGQFNAVGGDSAYAYLCRLNADGSLDPSFTPPALNTIYNVAPTADGKLVIGGVFSVGGRNNIARLNDDGSHDTSFTANTSSSRYVYALLQMPDGGWLAGCRFGTMYRYDANGVQDGAWSTQGGGDIWALALEQDGQVLVGGSFTSIGGESLNRLARLNADGSIDPAFTVGAGANGVVYAISLRPLGQIWIGGQFNNYRGVVANELTLLNGDPLDLAIVQDPVDTAVEPGQTAMFTISAAATDPVSFQWQRNGVNLTDGGDISGATTDTLSIANAEDADEDHYRAVVTHDVTMETQTSAAAELVVLGPPEILAQPESVATEAGLDTSFAVSARGVAPLMFQWFRDGVALTDGPNVSGATTSELTLTDLTVADSGDITVRVSNGLGFLDSNAATLLVEKLPAGIARDITLPLSVNSTINDVLPLDDGSYIIGGFFTSISYTGGSASRRGLAKFNADGSADLDFPRLNNGGVEAIARAYDGKFYVGGSFTSVRFGFTNVSVNRLIRLNADGTQDTSFDIGTGPNGTVLSILPLANGKVMIGGSFNSVAGQADTAYVVLLNEDGSVDTSFVPLATTNVNDIAPDGTGGYWLSHANSYDGQNRIVRIDGSGAKATGFNYTGNMTSFRVLGNPDGSAYSLSTSGPFIQRVEADGTFNDGWPADGVTNPDDDVEAGLLLPDGKLVIGGDFDRYNFITRNRIAVLETDGSLNTEFDPLEGLNGTPTAIRRDAEGRLWVVGAFNAYQGETVPRMVVLNGFDPAGDPFTSYLDAAGVPAGQQAPDNDYDLDGWANLLEFLYDSNPADSAGGLGVDWNPTNASPTGATINANEPGAGLDPAKRYRTVHVRVPVDKKDLTVGLEAGLDLTDFGSGSVQVHPLGTPIPDGPDHEIQVYYLTPSMADEPRMFWRLKVEQ